MKKRILAIAVVAMSLVGFTSMAQNNADNNAGKERTEQMKGKKGGMKDHKARMNPFEGLNLTDAQKAQLQELGKKQMEARKQQAEQRKADKQRNKETLMQERRAQKKAFLDQVKAIVGPDQYVTFLENMALNNMSDPGKGKAFRQGPGNDKGSFGKKDRQGKGNRGPRGDRKAPRAPEAAK